jgi:hypothetical protein
MSKFAQRAADRIRAASEVKPESGEAPSKPESGEATDAPATPPPPAEIEVDLGNGPTKMSVADIQALARQGAVAKTTLEQAKAAQEEAAIARQWIDALRNPATYQQAVDELYRQHNNGQAPPKPRRQPEGDGWDGADGEDTDANTANAESPQIRQLQSQIGQLYQLMQQQQQASASAATEARLESAIGTIPALQGNQMARQMIRTLATNSLRTRENPNGITDDVNLAVQTAWRQFKEAQISDPPGTELGTVSPRGGGAGTSLDAEAGYRRPEGFDPGRGSQRLGGLSEKLLQMVNSSAKR